jgi:hypothetical protein
MMNWMKKKWVKWGRVYKWGRRDEVKTLVLVMMYFVFMYVVGADCEGKFCSVVQLPLTWGVGVASMFSGLMGRLFLHTAKSPMSLFLGLWILFFTYLLGYFLIPYVLFWGLVKLVRLGLFMRGVRGLGKGA